jgi:hypothetical protein
MTLALPGRTMKRSAALLSFASLSLASGVAFAQYAPPPPPGYAPPAPGYAPPPPVAPAPFPDRQGFTIGLGLGYGTLSSDTVDAYGEPDTSIGFSLRAGVAMRQDLLLQAEVAASADFFGEEDKVQMNFYGASLTGYVHPRVYLVGGLGVAGLVFNDLDGGDDDDWDDKPGLRPAGVIVERELDSEMTGALLLGAGVELFQSSHFAFSLEARTLIASFDDVDEGTTVATNVLFGLQWW